MHKKTNIQTIEIEKPNRYSSYNVPSPISSPTSIITSTNSNVHHKYGLYIPLDWSVQVRIIKLIKLLLIF